MFSALMDSRSKWLVGSSSTRTFGFCSMSLQKSRRAASPPERTSVFLLPSSRWKQHLPQQAANFFVRGRRVPLMQPFECCRAMLDQSSVVLREVADGGFVSPDDFSAGQERAVVAAGFTQLGFRNCRRVGQQRIQQCRLAHAVAPHERDLFAADDAGGEIADHRVSP